MSNFKWSNPGSRYRDVRQPVVDDDGSVKVVVVGQEDLQAEINSHADECNVSYLVERAANGDPLALNQRPGMYGDFTQYPKTYAEMLQRVIDAESFFSTLDPKVRAEFGNDVFKFIAGMDQPDWAEKAGFVKPSDDSVSEEVKE